MPPPDTRSRIFLVEDHPMFREQLRLLIDKEEDPNSTKATFLRGYQQGCPIGAMSLVLTVGIGPRVTHGEQCT